MIDVLLFYFFSVLVLGGGILTITRRNAVMSAVCLVVSLLGVAGIFLLLGAEFLFVAQLILYVGGIVLLFLFVIMLVNLEAAAKVRQFRRSWPLVTLAGLGLAASQLVASPNGARALAAGALLGMPIVAWQLHEAAGLTTVGRLADLGGLFIATNAWPEFWSVDPGAFTMAVARSVVLAVLYYSVGHVVFSRRDL